MFPSVAFNIIIVSSYKKDEVATEARMINCDDCVKSSYSIMHAHNYMLNFSKCIKICVVSTILHNIEYVKANVH